MEIMLVTFGIFMGVILMMSVGVLFKGKPIKGSCGGIANLMGSCDVCDKKTECIDKMKASDDCATDCH